MLWAVSTDDHICTAQVHTVHTMRTHCTMLHQCYTNTTTVQIHCSNGLATC
jgi:hypothetical protein